MVGSARDLELPGRGSCRIRRIPGPAAGPVTLLLHGWTATADLNWSSCYSALSTTSRSVALDQRGHGAGVRGAFSLEACADDAADALRALGTGPAVVIGYSMGGPVAMLLWRRHPELVAGLVLCATASAFPVNPLPRLALGALGTVGREVLPRLRHTRRVLRSVRNGCDRLPREALPARLLDAIPGHDPVALVEAGRALLSFQAEGWLADIDVPCTSVVTTRDRVVPPHRQLRVAERIPGCTVVPLRDGHVACLHPDRFVPALLTALRDVRGRVGGAVATRPIRRAIAA